MRWAILAILYHSVKLSDKDKRHQYCPEDEWCEYRKTGTETENQNHLDPVFLDLLLPIFTRLSKPDLLATCLPGITQNQNESFHALIWKRCPKHLWRGPRVVRTAVDLAILASNCGAESSRYRVFQHLNLTLGAHTIESLKKRMMLGRLGLKKGLGRGVRNIHVRRNLGRQRRLGKRIKKGRGRCIRWVPSLKISFQHV